jgi:hypothetical protein
MNLVNTAATGSLVKPRGNCTARSLVLLLVLDLAAALLFLGFLLNVGTLSIVRPLMGVMLRLNTAATLLLLNFVPVGHDLVPYAVIDWRALSVQTLDEAAVADELIRTCPIGERMVYTTASGAALAELPTIPEAELSRAHVVAGPPGMVGSSNDISIWAALWELAIEADNMTVVDFITGLRTIAAVPAEDRLTDCAITLSSS